MRFVAATLYIVLAGCSAQTDPRSNASASQGNANATPRDPNLRSDESATSESATAAKAVAARYYGLIAARKYREAWLLWGNGGADSRGTAEAFAKSFERYANYVAKVGAPTDIKAVGDMQYITISIEVMPILKTGARGDKQSGTLLLRRSTRLNEPVADKKDWRIWGADVRVRH